MANPGDKSVENIEIVVKGVATIDATGARTTSRHLQSAGANLGELKVQGNGTYFFPNVKSLPPGHSVELQVIGDFRHLWSNRVAIRSSVDAIVTTRSIKLRGFLALVSEYGEPLLLLFSLLLLGLGYRRISEKKTV